MEIIKIHKSMSEIDEMFKLGYMPLGLGWDGKAYYEFYEQDVEEFDTLKDEQRKEKQARYNQAKTEYKEKLAKINIKQIEYRGKTQSLSEWCNELGLSYQVAYIRIRQLGWTIESTFTTPVQLRTPQNKTIKKEPYDWAEELRKYIAK